MPDQLVCICGHKADAHWELDEDIDRFYNEGTGRCNTELRESGHQCSSCSMDPSDYCQCEKFKADNLRYLEEKSGGI